jgi:predicted nucleic-acid-binding protein
VIAVDTSVLVRYVMQDDRHQSARANALFETELSDRNPGFLTLVTLAEFYWVLRRRFGVPAARIGEAVRELLAAPAILVEQIEVVEAALTQQRSDFADCLVHYSGAAAGCERTVTFDRTFARIDGVELLRG